MSRGQNKSIGLKYIPISCFHTGNFLVGNYEVNHFFLKQKLTAAFNYFVAHCCYDMRQLISANMRMRFIQYFFLSAKMYKEVQDPVNISPFAAAGI